MSSPGNGPLVALVGCGRWGRHILRDLRQLGAEVVVVDPLEEARQHALAAGAHAAFTSARELPDIAGVVVATPTVMHADVVEALLPRGVPVFVEKPLTADPERAARLAQCAPERLFVMDKWRYHPGVELLGRIARSGELGPVRGLRSHRLGWDGPHADVDPLWILAPHDLSIALEVLGHIPEPRVAVMERVGVVPLGMIAVLGDEPWLVFETSALAAERRRDLRLVCRDGVATLRDPAATHVEVIRDFDPRSERVPVPERLAISSEWPLLRELRTFLQHLAGGPPPRSTAAEGAAAVRVLARLRELAGDLR